MIAEISPEVPVIATQIHALAQAAYRVEAGLIGCADFPPLRETADELRQSKDRFFVNRRGDEIVGVLSFDDTHPQIVITRLVVSPAWHRQGIATALLDVFHRVIGESDQPRSVIVSTASSNLPAIRLYERFGYVRIRDSVSPEGIRLLALERVPASRSS